MSARPIDLPPLAGLCTWEEAQRSGMDVEECVTQLKRIHYVLVRLHAALNARITAEPLYELKTAFSLHSYLAAEHIAALRKRVSEMREPPLGLENIPHPGLELLGDELIAAPSTQELLLGIYGCVLPSLQQAIRDYQARTNHLADAPSVRVLRFCAMELDDMTKFGAAAIDATASPAQRDDAATWLQMLEQAMASAGGILGTVDVSQRPPLPAKAYSNAPYVYDRVPKRDERFQDSYNAGVNPESFLYNEQYSARDKSLMMLYKRIREIDVPEMMASIIHEVHGKPWNFYRDMSRQLWDEARHAMLGEVGFVHLGIDWATIPINFTWSLNLNTQLTPQERHAVLFFIEQGLMPRMGKRYEWEVAKESGIPLMGVFQDFDWADEVLHAQIGREWYVKDFGDLESALAYGDRCWSQVLSHWEAYREQGLTEHRNWWPEIYATACRNWQTTPDPAALAYHETYQKIRADLKQIAASG